MRGRAEGSPYKTKRFVSDIATSSLALRQIRLPDLQELFAQRMAPIPGRIDCRFGLAISHGTACDGGFHPDTPDHRSL
ncbi:hypothetical protein [Candidatus Methylacidiphilum fumarolicum]|nr:hypothetical protein [Candidatus Methylacidiphilum fumarolicum]